MKIIPVQDKRAALDLAWKVFSDTVAPDYTARGAETFKKYLADGAKMDALAVYGAYADGKMAGMIALAAGHHIALFFVDETFRGRGVGRKLFNRMLEEGHKTLTVNSSPGAVKIYERLGFAAHGPARTVEGMVFIPMEYKR